MLNIITGVIIRALKIIIYGVEGVGKSTLAAQFPDPLFIDVEGGTSQMNVRRIQRPATWEELLSLIIEVAKTPGICKTLVLDTLDWAEALCIEFILGKFNQKSIEAFGYGRGYTYLAEEWSKLVAALNAVIASGVNVVAIAHARQRKIELPDQAGSFDHWELKLTKQVAPVMKEWSDLLLFCNYETFVVSTETNSKKAVGGRRVMYTNHAPTYDAKNRHNLPDVMDLDFSGLAPLFGDAEPAPSPIDQLRGLMERDGITEEELRSVVAQKGHYAEAMPITEYPESFITGWCIRHWPNIVKLITAAKTAQTEDKESK